MGKYTPGPWHVRTYDGSQWGVDAEGDLPIAQAQQVRPLPTDPKQQERTANAHLIAAAPDLLEALRECRRVMLVEDSLRPGYGWADHVAKHVDPVIAKATREQP